MKKVFLAFTALTLTLGAAAPMAQQKMDDMKGMEMKPATATAGVNTASGTVTNSDVKAGKVTLAHGPVKTLNWPAMTMTFKVADQKIFDKLAPGKKVNFDFKPDGSDYVITSVR